MIELAWFVAGVAAAAVLTRTWRHRRPPVEGSAPASPVVATAQAPATPAAVTPTSPQREPAPVAPPGRTRETQRLTPAAVTVDSRHLASSLADELANLASGLEGCAHDVIDAATDRARLPRAAEALLNSVQRVRTLHNKLAAFGHVARPARGTATTCLRELIALLGDQLQKLQLGLEVRWEPPQHLPEAAIPPDVASDALLFLCSAMLRAERGATRLSIASETCFAGSAPRVQLELGLEWSTEGLPSAGLLDDPTFTLDLEAANQLVAEHGGDLTIHHLPGRCVRAVVRWPIVERLLLTDSPARPQPAAPATPEPASAEHRYGGALVLESDPSVRAMLASELKATGRAVFACADTTSARTFLEATPDRFELLIVDHHQRLDDGDALARTIRAVAPGLKIFVLAASPLAADAAWPQLHHIQKPFGVHELRHALASVLAAG